MHKYNHANTHTHTQVCMSYTLTKKLMNISNIIQAEQGLFINILTYLHMYSYIIVIYKYIATINEKKGL